MCTHTHTHTHTQACLKLPTAHPGVYHAGPGSEGELASHRPAVHAAERKADSAPEGSRAG